MADYITVGGIDFEIRRNPRRQRVALGFDTYGTYFIAAPLHTSFRELKQIADDNADGFIDKVRNRKRKPAEPPYTYSNGELFYFRGAQYPLALHTDVSLPSFEFTGSAFRCFNFEDKTELREHIRRWYVRRLEELLHKELPPLCKKIGKGPSAVHIKDVKTLWGSCSRSGSMTFNIRLAMALPEEMEYVMIHELCHFYEMNHSKRFWELVSRYCPDYKKIRAGLKSSGSKYRW